MFAFSAFLCDADNVENYKFVETEYGPVRGQKLLTIFDDKPYYSFRGIPFVEAPVGDLRFKVGILSENYK